MLFLPFFRESGHRSMYARKKKKSIEKIHDRKLRISSLILAIMISMFFALFLESGNFLLLEKKSLNKSVPQE